jgi:hypothetical protein
METQGPVKELVRFGYKDTLVRITRETGFEQRSEGTDEWVKADIAVVLHGDQTVALALNTLIHAAATLDDLEKDMGKQVFLAAIRTPA